MASTSGIASAEPAGARTRPRCGDDGGDLPGPSAADAGCRLTRRGVLGIARLIGDPQFGAERPDLGAEPELELRELVELRECFRVGERATRQRVQIRRNAPRQRDDLAQLLQHRVDLTREKVGRQPPGDGAPFGGGDGLKTLGRFRTLARQNRRGQGTGERRSSALGSHLDLPPIGAAGATRCSTDDV